SYPSVSLHTAKIDPEGKLVFVVDRIHWHSLRDQIERLTFLLVGVNVGWKVFHGATERLHRAELCDLLFREFHRREFIHHAAKHVHAHFPSFNVEEYATGCIDGDEHGVFWKDNLRNGTRGIYQNRLWRSHGGCEHEESHQ